MISLPETEASNMATGRSTLSSYTDSELRILVMGSDPLLQSSIAAFILRHHNSSNTLPSDRCHVAHDLVNGRNIVVINAPGLLDGTLSEDKLKLELQRLYFQSSPGPHVMLYISKSYERDIDKVVYDRILAIFGKELVDRSIFVFQEYGDMMDFSLSMRRPARFKRKVPVSQRTSEEHCDLLSKIEEVLQEYGGTYFVNDMLREAEKCLQEHTKILLSKTQTGKELEMLKQELLDMKSKQEEDKKRIEELEGRIYQATEASNQTEASLRREERDNLINDETMKRVYRGLMYVSEKLILQGIVAVMRSYLGF